MVKQRMHVRKLNTNKGVRRVVVNKGFRKPRKQVVINPTEKKIFSYLGNHKRFRKEYGGGIDFDKSGKIENINVVPGTYGGVLLDDDYEVIYHTHPGKLPPSPMDIISIIAAEKQQAELVFSEGDVFMVLKPVRLVKNSKDLFDKLEKKYDSIEKSPTWIKEWSEFVKAETGLKIIHKKNHKNRLVIPITPVEPRNKKETFQDILNKII